jgi:hypothetical protein
LASGRGDVDAGAGSPPPQAITTIEAIEAAAASLVGRIAQ